MAEPGDKLNELHTRLENLAKYETAFKREIAEIRRQINLLKSERLDSSPEKPAAKAEPNPVLPRAKIPPPNTPPERAPRPKPVKTVAEPFESFQTQVPRFDSQGVEKYIGKYLISIVGVLVTVIGVGIGAKYAIDNNWITPLMRIVFGYAVGLGLVGFATHLKAKYHTFSAVLLSGGMAIMYFITYFAYSYYYLMSQTTAFALMVIFTVFTVVSAIIYDRQVIALIGLVGAYAVPLLLSDGSGNVQVLFTYVAILNVGILAVSLSKYWKLLFFSAFSLTWLIYAAWFADSYRHSEHFALAFMFSAIFFTTFYVTFLAYKAVHESEFSAETIPLIVLNSFAFFGFGYAILNTDNWRDLLGLFTIANALIHFGVAAMVQKFKLADDLTFYIIIVLVLTFFTVAAPIQFDGDWVTICWMAEGTFLFVIGRTKRIPLFEIISYGILSLGLLSLLGGWLINYKQSLGDAAKPLVPVLNGGFATAIFAVIALAIIHFVNGDERYESQTEENIDQAVSYIIPTILLIVLYNTFRIEIGNYFYGQALQTAVTVVPDIAGLEPYMLKNQSLEYLNIIWQMVYSMFFLSVLSLVNISKLKSWILGYVNLALNAFVKLAFLTGGLIILGDLRESYLTRGNSEHFTRGIDHLAVRYISFALLFLLFIATYSYIKREFINEIIPSKYLLLLFELAVSASLFLILSSELIHWTQIFNIAESYKLGLSILWGLYAIALIVFGIFNKKKHIRLFAIGLFALTLLKLFTYDLAELETIPKTIVFVSTGILLIIASYLYNRFTKLIFEDEN